MILGRGTGIDERAGRGDGRGAARLPITRLTRRRLVDSAMSLGFIAAWLTHDQGVLVHSITSVMFTTAAAAHVNGNWPTYRGRWRTARIDHATLTAFAVTTATGLIYWLGGGRWSLGHGGLSVASTIVIITHLWHHRRSLRRLVARRLSE